jgi:predicted RNase H-like HicB family nuclease
MAALYVQHPVQVSVSLPAIYWTDGTHWYAQHEGFGLYGDGPTIDEALADLARAVEMQIEASIRLRNPGNLISEDAKGKR